MGARELLGACAEQRVAFPLVAVEPREQPWHVFAASNRQLGLQLDAHRLGAGAGRHPFRQRARRALGWGVDNPPPRGTAAGDLLGGDQPRALELLQHRVQPLGLDLPGGAEAAVEAVGEVVAVAGVLHQQAQQGALQR
jgi:hypothetical protein